jgi:N utilization substance protein A
MRVYAEREVVDEVFNGRTEITQEDANKLYPGVKLGDVVKVESKPDNFGRIAAQTAKQVILQRIREAERDTVFENFAHRVGEVINAQVRSTDNASGAVTVMLDDKHEALLMREEQIPNERLRRGDYVKVYVVDVHKSTRGPVIKLSRTHRNLLRRLMEQEIPEVREGTVEIKAIAREPGARSKAAVVATVPGVDPVGSCVGMRGLRIQNIVNELAGEKIDVVEWNNEVPGYIANALSPAKVNSVYLDETGTIKTAIVVVPDRQLSLAIGKEGQNARLAAKLTGWRIDIKSESEAMKEGLDRLAAEQAQQHRAADLFSVVERFLQDEGTPPPPVGEDLLSKAARALEERESRSAEPAQEAELPSLEMPEMPLDRRDFRDLWPVEGFELPETPIGEQLEPEESDEEPAVTPSFAEVEQEPVASADEGEMTLIGDLPEVITADMLRARRAKGIDLSQDFEIPAELLIGLEEEEVEDIWEAEEDDRKKSRTPVKPKAKTKTKQTSKKPAKPEPKGKKWKRGGFESDDF